MMNVGGVRTQTNNTRRAVPATPPETAEVQDAYTVHLSNQLDTPCPVSIHEHQR
jgi:hypothetical protein